MGRFSTMGYMMGEDGPVAVRALRANMLPIKQAPAGTMMPLPTSPDWRDNQVAPGLWGPRAGMEILPMEASTNGGIFDPTHTNIMFTGRPQRPFRPERLICKVGRRPAVPGGLNGTFVLCQGIYVGVKLQQLQLGEFDIEVYSEQAFGVRMALDAADPGILVQIPLRVDVVPGAGDSIAVSMQWLGSSLM